MIRLEINNNTTKLTGNSEVLSDLYHTLKFKHPDAYHIKKYIRYYWDGFVYPISNKGVIKTGLLDTVLEITSEDELEYEVEDHRKIPIAYDIPTVIGGTKIHAHSVEVLKAIAHNELLPGCPHPRGIVLASMNAGKTLMMCGVHMMYRDAKTIILLESSTLYKQMKEDLSKIFPDSYGYMQGKKIQWGDIMIVMVQTLKNRLKEYESKLLEYQVLLTDEADLASNKTFETVYSKLHHMPIRLGFTGTAFMRQLAKDKLRNIKMLEIFGNVLYDISMKDLEDWGISTPVVMKSVWGNTGQVSTATDFKSEFDQLITFNKARHKKICKRVLYNLKAKRTHIMIFCKYIDQATETYAYLQPRIPKKYSIEVTHHKTKDSRIIEDFKSGKLNILICTLYLKRGMNFPWIQVIINASGGAFYSNPLQIIGRGVRKHKKKMKLYVEDIYDMGKYLEKHSKQRLKYYRDQRLTIRDLRKLKK